MLWTKEGEKGMTETGLIICLCVIGILLMIALSTYTAYKTVFSSETVCKKEKKWNQIVKSLLMIFAMNT